MPGFESERNTFYKFFNLLQNQQQIYFRTGVLQKFEQRHLDLIHSKTFGFEKT